MAKVMRGHIRQTAVLHKPLYSACNGIWIPGDEYISVTRKHKAVLQDGGRMLRLPLLFETMEQGQGAAHERDNAAAVCGLGGINNKSASGCISDVALNLNHGAGRVNVPPFKSHTFAAPQTRCNEQMEHTTELQGAGIKSLEKGGCVLL